MDAVAGSQTAMDAVAGSKTAMDAVVGSQTAMDTVSASQTAIDAVIASQLALDTVVASQTAMDSVAASQTAMDAVSASQTAIDAVIASQLALDTVVASQTAMDSVAASQTAMDSIMTSLLARSVLLQSQFASASVWKQQTASQRVFDEGSTFSVIPSNLSFAFIDVFSDSAIDFQIQFDGNVNQDRVEGLRLSLDFDLINELNIDTAYTGDQRQGANFLGIKAGADTLFETDVNHSQTTRTLDTSSITGTKDLKLVYEQKDGIVNDTFDMTFGIITG
jgi:hypothetical protein